MKTIVMLTLVPLANQPSHSAHSLECEYDISYGGSCLGSRSAPPVSSWTRLKETSRVEDVEASQIKARRKQIKNRLNQRFCVPQRTSRYLSSPAEDTPDREEDNGRRSCCYLLFSKIRSGRLSILSPALVAGFIHFNKMNSGE